MALKEEGDNNDNTFWMDMASMVLVGALWGCTNPILRKGAVESSDASKESNKKSNNNNNDKNTSNDDNNFLRSTLKLFCNIKVILPYLFNQFGSIVFYILLANSNLSVAVPVCNALSLVFSLTTGLFIGEPIEKPFLTFVGAGLVLIGTTICVSSSSSSGQEEQN